MQLILASASPRRRDILVEHGVEPIVFPSNCEEPLPEDADDDPTEAAKSLAELKALAVTELVMSYAKDAEELKERLMDALIDAYAADGGGKKSDQDLSDEAARIATEVAEALERVATMNEKLFILGVDTIVVKDRIIGKPVDEADALSILRSLSGATHTVISGCCLFEVCAAPNSVDAMGRPFPVEVDFETLFFDETLVTFEAVSDEEILAYIRANPPYDKSGAYAIQSEWGRHVTHVEGSVENVIGLPWEEIAPYLGLDPSPGAARPGQFG